MSYRHTVTRPNGEILTGKTWRKDHSFFNDLPFYSNIPRMDEMAGPLRIALGEDGRLESHSALLVKFGIGLDEVHPFSDSPSVDKLLRDAEKILSLNTEAVGARNAARIWGFISKFVMLDRFSKTLGAAEVYPGIPVPKKMCSGDCLGTGSKILDELNPPTKVLGKFLRRWRDRETHRAECFKTTSIPSSVNRRDNGDVTLTISKRLVAVVKAKDILHIEAGLEMITLAMAISSENGGVFPEMPSEVKNVLRSIWESQMDPQHFEDISTEIQALHKPMKNLIAIVFAISPLLALSTHGWDFHNIHGTSLLRIFLALGNDRPQILIQLEDLVLHAILAISEGRLPEDVIDGLYSEVLSLEKDLGQDQVALNWFNFSMASDSISPTPPPSTFPITRFDAMPNLFKARLQGGLASPPDSRNNSPHVSNVLSSTSSTIHVEKLSPLQFVNPRDLHDSAESFEDALDRPQWHNSTDEGVDIPADVKSTSSPSSPSPSDDGDGRNGVTAIESKKALSNSSQVDDDCDRTIHSESNMFLLKDGDFDGSTKVKSNELELDPIEVEERVDEMILVESKMSESNLSDGNEDGNRMIGVEFNDPSLDLVGEEGKPVIDVGSKESPDEGVESNPTSGSKSHDGSESDDSSSDSAENEGVLMMDVESEELPEGDKEGERTTDPEFQEPSLDSTENKGEPMMDVEPQEFPHGGKEEDPTAGPESSLDSAESKGDPMIVVESKDPLDLAKDGGGHPITGVDSTKSSESSRDGGKSSDSDPFIPEETPFEPRRSSRNADGKKKAPLKIITPPKLSGGKRKPAVKIDAIILESDSEEEWPKLSDVGKARYQPTLYAEIAGWGSTIEMGPKPYRHVAVQIVPPGNVASTGDDTETLRKVEARIKANFRNGLPPHLQPNARSMSYVPGSDQSRIFVTSSSEFSGLNAKGVQSVLRERLILVHGNLFDYKYGWDLESFGRVYDVDKKVTVHVSTLSNPLNPDIRHHQGTLREFHEMTTTLSNEDCPPLNAISLSAHRRNLYIPCQLGSLASHEVAQSRLPLEYEKRFDVPDIKSKLEWSLIGGRGAISPFHVDSEGFATVVVVLEGSKYWIVATGLGEHEKISSVDSLGPTWNPYFINDGDNIDRFRFEAVHLQKGDMLIMPPGVPHWVLGTSNTICVGRFFYGASTISLSVITIVHTFLLGGAVTNEDYLETRTLLYQLIVFWSTRMDKTDVDGAHIADMSSAEGFFDILYLGIFVILSRAFDSRFYQSIKPSPTLNEEVTYAIRHFHSLLHIFSLRFTIFLDGGAVTLSYVVDRMLAEFAAASVVFANSKDGNDSHDESEGGITSAMFSGRIEGILHESYPRVVPYYVRCLEGRHKHFLWTGPKVQILPRSEDVLSILPLTTVGELLDLPTHQIYPIDVDDGSANDVVHVGKRHDREDGVDLTKEHPNKRNRVA